MTGYAVRYQCRGSEFACFQGFRGVAMGYIQSEVDPACIHVWASVHKAARWILTHHADLSKPLPLGDGSFYAAVVPVDTRDWTPRPWWMRGALFEFPRAAVMTATTSSTRKTSSPRPVAAGPVQMSLF